MLVSICFIPNSTLEIVQLDPLTARPLLAHIGCRGGNPQVTPTGYLNLFYSSTFAIAVAIIISPYLVTHDDDCRITVCILYFALLECSCFHLGDSSAVMNPHGAWVSAYSPNHGLFVLLRLKSARRKKKHPLTNTM